MALDIVAGKGICIDTEEVEAAAMLHDIGIFLCHAPGIGCNGKDHYLRHGILGADLLRSGENRAILGDGVAERMARVAERHTGSGISREDIVADGLPLPLDRGLLPESTLERLVCYADKFYSKSGSMERKPLGKVMTSMTHFGPEAYRRFLSLHGEFGS